MVSVEYSEAITEVLDILNHTRKDDVNKISAKFMSYLQENASKTYKPQFDHNQKIKDMQLKSKTKAILAIIYMKFWSNDEKKKNFDKILKENDIKYQSELREKYDSSNLFQNRAITQQSQPTIQNDIDLIEVEEKFFGKLIRKIKNIFNIR